ncbi:MAG TPA: PAS domain-containing protein [Ideonella sp.]|nr:PAS domain-containing protein [Ideonella sp.]
MPNERARRGQTVLILAPAGHDAASIEQVLARRQCRTRIVGSLAELAGRVGHAAGAVVITSEALTLQDPAPLLRALDAQPSWSDLPFVYLGERRTGRPPPGAGLREKLPPQINHVMVLERPLGADTLASAVDWALSARGRQFQVRDHMEELAARAEQLRESERALSESRSYLRDLLDASGEGIYAIDEQGITTVCNAACRRLLGFAHESDVVGRPWSELVAHHRADGSLYRAQDNPVQLTALGGAATHVNGERFARPGGLGFPVEYWAQPVVRGGRLCGALCTFIDVSAREQAVQALRSAEQALKSSEAELRLVADSLPVLIAFIDRQLVYRFANRAYEDWFYVDPEAVVGRSVQEVLGESGYRERAAAMHEALAGRTTTLQAAWPHRDGRRRDADIRYLPRFDAEGRVDGFHVFVLDVTEREEAAEVLRRGHSELEALVAERTAALHAEMQERQQAEEALRQSQKMEAVGQLTGGIAHDFNNLLQGITGSLAVIKKRLAAGRSTDLDRFIGGAMTSAQRAAALTHRLLAFSRRQPLDAKPARLNPLVETLQDLLQRTLGEQVTLTHALADDLWLTLCDANQLESSLLNLAINARDAMPGGGRLSIATRNARFEAGDAELARDAGGAAPGDYVCVAVTDTGEGMSRDVIARAFDPFFTTKPIGQGTGLGLSMIYGFARQSQGFCRIASELGRGTTVSIYLPRFTGETGSEAPAHDGVDEAAPVPARDGEVVLVVEDDEIVRSLVVEALQEAGYRALQAGDGPAGLELLRRPQRIDLLLTDVGLPGLNGRQVADAARLLRPQLKVLLMTGYAENAAIPSGFLAPGMALLTKPFAIDSLAARIREMMQSPQMLLPAPTAAEPATGR